jgi:hypothetical protein
MKAVSVSYFVRYEGRAESPQELLAHYRDRHVPLLARFPKIRRILLHTPTAWQEARAEARRNFGQLPRFQGVVYHQAAVSAEVFSQ